MTEYEYSVNKNFVAVPFPTQDPALLTVPFPTQSPALPTSVKVPLTTILLISYGVLFLLAYIQLFLIWYYKHKRVSYQTSLLFLILIWCSLRLTLFSFYFKNIKEANNLCFFFYFCLYCLPVVLQFGTFCVLVLYYGQVYFKIANRNMRRKYSINLRIILIMSVFIFFASSITTAYLTKNNSGTNKLFQISLSRICINDFLFVIFGFILSAFLFKLAKLSLSHVIPEQNNISVLKAIVVTSLISLLLISRFVYNLFAITAVSLKLPEFNFDFINVSDQADLVDLSEKKKFISFFVVLAIWELIPTIVIISLFRLRRNDSLTNFRSTSTSSFARKSIFVDSGITSENEFYEPSNEQRRLINDDFESLSEEQSSSGHNNRNYCSINSYKI